jgi:hypothetical protein
LPDDDDQASNASSRFVHQTGNIETGGSDEDQKLGVKPFTTYLKDSGSMSNSFSKFTNHNIPSSYVQTQAQI